MEICTSWERNTSSKIAFYLRNALKLAFNSRFYCGTFVLDRSAEKVACTKLQFFRTQEADTSEVFCRTFLAVFLQLEGIFRQFRRPSPALFIALEQIFQLRLVLFLGSFALGDVRIGTRRRRSADNFAGCGFDGGSCTKRFRLTLPGCHHAPELAAAVSRYLISRTSLPISL